jgi:hypothetical protein
LVLSTNLGYKDFFAKVGGVASPLVNWTKTNSTLLIYTGVALAANTPVQVFRDSDRIVADFTFGEVNTSFGLNDRFDQLERIVEDLRQMTNP